MPYIPPPVPPGYRIVEVGELICDGDIFDNCGKGIWKSAKSYIGFKLPARVAFATRLKIITTIKRNTLDLSTF